MTGHFVKGAWIKDTPQQDKGSIGELHFKICIDRTEFDKLLEDATKFESLLFLKWMSKHGHNSLLERIRRWFE